MQKYGKNDLIYAKSVLEFCKSELPVQERIEGGVG